MLRSLLVSPALLVGSLLACDAPAATEPAAPVPAVGAAAKPDDDAAKSDARAALLAKRRGALQESRELAEAYAAGSLGERLAVGEMLLVDTKAPADTDQVRMFVLSGPLAPVPTKVSELEQVKGADGSSARAILQGGEDSGRPGLFREIKPGTYTVCAVLGPPTSAAKAAFVAQAGATYKAEAGDKLDAAKLQDVAARVQAETGYEPDTIDWDKLPLRCKQTEVTPAAASRVVVIDPG